VFSSRRVLVSALLLLTIFRTPIFAQTQIASVSLSSGWATFGQAVPRGFATTGLVIAGVATQTDVKSRWPDGSIKFAVLTARIATSGTYTVVSAPAGSGSFVPQLPVVTATFTIAGVQYTATLPSATSTDLWLSGPLVYEGRSTIAPTGAAAHPFLRVNFDTRIYNDGTGRLDVSVENVLNQTGATTITYDVAIAVGGSPVFTRAALKHFYLTRWRKTFPINGATFAAITPDIRPFNSARILPPYLSMVSNVVSSPTGAAFDLLGAGALDPDMPAHGGRAELAPYPDWTARYLVHKNATQRSYVLANGDLSGSWPIHVREAETSTKPGVGSERFVSLDQRPTFWYDARAQSVGNDFVRGTPLPIREYSGATPTALQTALTPDNAHQPSIAYVPYLLTGDRYYAEEMAFWANYGMLRTYPGDDVRGAAGILESNETRGYGWALRNLAEAAALYPDASPVKAYLSQKVANNLTWLDNYANAQPPTNPFKILWIGLRPDGTQYIALWEQNYLAYAIDRASKLGFTGGLAHRDAIARFQVKLLSSDPEYPRAEGAPYIVAIGPALSSVRYTDYPTYPFFQSLSQIWAGTMGNERPFAGYYGPEARLNVMMGVEAGWTGAQAAYNYLWPFIGVTATWGALPDLAQRAGWALDFYPAPASLATEVAIDGMPNSATLTLPFAMQGWAVNRTALTGTGVDAIHVHAFPAGGGAPTFLGSAAYGATRTDVAAQYGSQFTNSGWSLSVSALTPGQYTIVAYAHNAATGVFDASAARTVTVAPPVSRPIISIDAPGAGATVPASFQVAGWAIDAGSPTGTGTDAVHVYAFPAAGGAPTFLGAAGYGAARADVGAIYGARFTNVGYNLSASLAPGSYMLVVYARSTLTGVFSSTARTITVRAGNPLMTIDTPGNGATVTRPFLLAGWAIDLDSTSGPGVDAVHVWAYPANGGSPVFAGVGTLNFARPDVGAIFGARFTNSGYNVAITSTTLPPGTYTLAVYAHSTVTGTFNNVSTVRITIP
jgi:hypothetical protein